MPRDNSLQTILFVHNSNDLYGADVILLNLIRGLDRSRFRPLVILPEDMQHINRLSARLDAGGIPYVFLPLGVIRRKYFTPTGLCRFVADIVRGTNAVCKVIRQNDVALVHSNTLTVHTGAIAAKLTGRPHVWHIHEISTASKWVRKTIHASVCCLSDRIVAVSNAVREHMLRDQPGAVAQIRTIHNGIDLTPYRCASDRTAFRNELGIPPDATVVGMVGRVSRWKGQSVFLEAARRVMKEREDVFFVAVGGVFDKEYHYMQSFRGLVESCGLKRFRICDFRQDIPAVLTALDLFVVPSILPDPFPTVVIEAMAAGRVVIGSACGGLPEMIIDGKTGALFPPGDANALAESILSILGDAQRLEAMGTAANIRALEAFQIGRFVHEFEDVYDALLANCISSRQRVVR